MPDFEAPQTYAEYYWANQLDVFNAKSEHAEKQFGPTISNLFDELGLKEHIPAAFVPFFSILQEPPSPDWDDIQRMFLGTVGRAVGLIAGEQMAKPFEYEAAEKFLHQRITAESAITLFQRKAITQELYDGRMHSAGYADDEAKHYYNSMLPYPSMPDIISWARYQETPDNPKAKAWEKFAIREEDWPLWEWLARMKLNTEQVQTLYKRNNLSDTDADLEFSQIGWQGLDKFWIKSLAYTLPNAMLLTQGNLLQGASRDRILDDISRADIHPSYAETYLDAVQIKPSSVDVIAYELRRDPSLSNLDSELHKVGVHPNYHELYKELAYQIPPVADIITMAVREAFTPEIARRFGQYEDLPDEFVEWVGKKGLSKDWASRYWAAHWALPSPLQGFEMLHRGIINRDELQMLMRALDIMPYWRDKMIEMAYRPLTRVDVRRMFGLGTLDEAGINKAYRDLGYNDYNAEKMTDFTVRYTRQTQSRFTSGDVVTAYTKYLITSSKAKSILRDIGIRDEEITNIIEKADYKREWSTKQETIDAVRNLYKKGKYDESTVRSKLDDLTLPSDFIDTQLQQWESKAVADVKATWTTAQTLTFLKKQLITEARARTEFEDLGYDIEHINVYIASAIPAP